MNPFTTEVDQTIITQISKTSQPVNGPEATKGKMKQFNIAFLFNCPKGDVSLLTYSVSRLVISHWHVILFGSRSIKSQSPEVKTNETSPHIFFNYIYTFTTNQIIYDVKHLRGISSKGLLSEI